MTTSISAAYESQSMFFDDQREDAVE